MYEGMPDGARRSSHARECLEDRVSVRRDAGPRYPALRLVERDEFALEQGAEFGAVCLDLVGGIADQIRDGVDGLLLEDPADLDEFAGALRKLLDDPALAEQMGAAGHEHARDVFLGDRHLRQWVDLFAVLVPSAASDVRL